MNIKFFCLVVLLSQFGLAAMVDDSNKSEDVGDSSPLPESMIFRGIETWSDGSKVDDCDCVIQLRFHTDEQGNRVVRSKLLL